MKKLLIAIFLIPAFAFAADKPSDAAQPQLEAAPVQQTDGTTTATTTTTSTEPAKTEEKKDAPAATATTTQTPATGQAVNASLMTPEQLAAAGQWTFGVNLDNSVGSGTFANAAYYASVVSSVSGSVTKPVRIAGKSFLVNGGLSSSYEFTRPDNQNGRRFSWADFRLGASMPGAIKEKITGISVNPAMSIGVPLTMESFYSGQLSSVGANVRFIRQVGPVSLRLGVGGNYTLATSAYRVQRPVANVVQTGGPLCRASDPAGSCGSAGLMSLGGVNTNLTALWFISDALVGWGQVGVGTVWNRAAAGAQDEYTPRGTRVDGSPVAFNGSIPANNTNASFGLSYNLTDIFSVSGGVSTMSPARTMDTKAFRFPLFDFRTPEMNLTSYTVSVSATL